QQAGAQQHLQAGDVRGGQDAQPRLVRPRTDPRRGGADGGQQRGGAQLHALGAAGGAGGGDDQRGVVGHGEAVGQRRHPLGGAHAGRAHRLQQDAAAGFGDVRGDRQQGGSASVQGGVQEFGEAFGGEPHHRLQGTSVRHGCQG